MDRRDEWAALLPQMQAWRRHLHRHPELSYQEEQTASFIAEQLRAMGLAPSTGVGGHGVVANLQGAAPGRAVALRADIDALPIQDAKTCEYRSTVPGVMHACGHDAHTAGLLGVGLMLSRHPEWFRGTIRLMFQPAEEVSPGGALPMIQGGVLEGIDAIYGVHLWSPFPAGRVYARSGPMWAAVDDFTITVIGKGGHGGMPHESVDSIMIASQLVGLLQTVVSRNLDPTAPCVVSVCSIHGGSGFNVIADTCTLKGTIRTFDEAVRAEAKRLVRLKAEQLCALHGAQCQFDLKEGYPALVNDPQETDRFHRVAQSAFGADAVLEAPLMMPGEDFAYYLQQRPGCFMLVGAGSDRVTAPHHHPLFDIEESAMLQAGELLLAMALDYLNEP